VDVKPNPNRPSNQRWTVDDPGEPHCGSELDDTAEVLIRADDGENEYEPRNG
jgi:hypothetical protein